MHKINEVHAPNWLSIEKYEAEATTEDKVSRVVNYLVFAAGSYGFYLYQTDGIGLSCLPLALSLRKMASATIGFLVYPVTLNSIQLNMQELGKEAKDKLNEMDFIVKKITLKKSGTNYAALLVTHPDTVQNGNWIINALGNCGAYEYLMTLYAVRNYNRNCNTLIVNGPAVGESGGWPTRYQMGACFEAGIRFLEEEVKATHIIMHGLSLGGGMMGEAILQHDFSKKIQYLSISDRTFSRLSSIVGALFSKMVVPLMYLSGSELDGIEAARKLTRLNIQHIIVQHVSEDDEDTDGVIPDQVSLAYELHQEPECDNRIFLESNEIEHGEPHPSHIKEQLDQRIQQFLATV